MRPVLSSSSGDVRRFFRLLGTPGVFFAKGCYVGGTGRSQKTGLFAFVTWPAERDEVVQADGASALINGRDVVFLKTLAGSAAPTAVAVPLLGCLPYLLPSARVTRLHACAIRSTPSTSLSLSGSTAVVTWPPVPRPGLVRHQRVGR